jgi:hypothetical protein
MVGYRSDHEHVADGKAAEARFVPLPEKDAGSTAVERTSSRILARPDRWVVTRVGFPPETRLLEVTVPRRTEVMAAPTAGRRLVRLGVQTKRHRVSRASWSNP